MAVTDTQFRAENVRFWLKVDTPKTQSMSLSGGKQTWLIALQMSAFDPKWSLRQFGPYLDRDLNLYDPPVLRLESGQWR